jgi:MmyB-like transcription regulator ligand binding domain
VNDDELRRAVAKMPAPARDVLRRAARADQWDILYANQLAVALYSELYRDPTRPVNVARFVFLDDHSTDFYADWHTAASDAVVILRAEAGRDLHDRALSDLVGELSTRSDDFRVRWAAHNVGFHRTGDKGSTTRSSGTSR